MIYETIGIIDRPERARRTDEDGDDKKKKIFTMSPQLLNMNKKARDVELPFAPPLKRVLMQAGQIADSFDSLTVNAEHVLLA